MCIALFVSAFLRKGQVHRDIFNRNVESDCDEFTGYELSLSYPAGLGEAVDFGNRNQPPASLAGDNGCVVLVIFGYSGLPIPVSWQLRLGCLRRVPGGCPQDLALPVRRTTASC